LISVLVHDPAYPILDLPLTVQDIFIPNTSHSCFSVLFPILWSIMEASKCSNHVRLPDSRRMHASGSGPAGPFCLECGLRGTRIRPPTRMILALAFFVLISPVTAFDDELHARPQAPRFRHHGYWTPIAYCLNILLLIGHQSVNSATTLVAPSMGITSVLWLMMRNDVAISPKASWM
jgi:hypothetical protein